MNILVWHVHGSWMTAFVQGDHRYFVPVLPDRGPDGRGRAQTWNWPCSVVEVTPEQAADADIDVVVLQRPNEVELSERWFGRASRRLPTVYVEHDTPPSIDRERHLTADLNDVHLVHVTHFNALMWDAGRTRTTVVEHGVVDPGHRYCGEIAAGVAVINEPIRRAWVTGADVLERCRRRSRIDLFGMAAEPLGGVALDQDKLHGEMARRRVYLHPNRWTSLGLSLIEAMHLGMPVVAVAATEVPRAVEDSCGAVTNDLDELERRLRQLIAMPVEEAAAIGAVARERALERYSLARFLADWDGVLAQA